MGNEVTKETPQKVELGLRSELFRVFFFFFFLFLLLLLSQLLISQLQKIDRNDIKLDCFTTFTLMKK